MTEHSPLCTDILHELKNCVTTVERLNELSAEVGKWNSEKRFTDEEFAAIVAAGKNCREAIDAGIPW